MTDGSSWDITLRADDDPILVASKCLAAADAITPRAAAVGFVDLPATWAEGTRLRIRRSGAGLGDADLLDPWGGKCGTIQGLRLAGIPPRGSLTGGLAMMFSGQGGQRARMGADLAATNVVFRDAWNDVLAALDGPLDPPLSAVVVAQPGTELAGYLDRTAWTQPAIFALQTALVAAWADRGVVPVAVLGHSVGEIAAAVTAGILDLPSACRLVLARGAAMEALPAGGAMAAIRLSEDETRGELTRSGVEIAAVNAPDQTVIAGDEQALGTIVARLEGRGVRCLRLGVQRAFHSARMDPALPRLRETLGAIRFGAARLPMISTLTGQFIGEGASEGEYWIRQARGAVRFADAVAVAGKAGLGTLLEIGPGAELARFNGASGAEGVRRLFTFDRSVSETEAFAAAVARLQPVDDEAPPVAAPVVVVERVEVARPTGAGLVALDHPWAHHALSLPDGGLIVLARVSVDAHPWLRDHVIAGRTLFPGAGMAELALVAAQALGLDGVRSLQLEAPVELGEHPVELQIRIDGSTNTMRIDARSGSAPWRKVAQGELGSVSVLDDLAPSEETREPTGALYDRLATSGMNYGPGFRTMIERSRDEALVRAASAEGFVLHPTVLDGALHLLAATGEGEPWMPFELRDLRVSAPGEDSVVARLDTVATASGLTGTCRLRDLTGRPVAQLGAIHARRVRREGLLHQFKWIPAVESAVPHGRWMVVGDGPEAARAVRALRAAGASVDTRSVFTPPDPSLHGWVWVPSVMPGEAPEAALRATIEAVPALRKVVADRSLATQRRWILLSGALVVSPNEVPRLEHAPLVGLLRAVRTEHGSAAPSTLDIDAASDAVLAGTLALGGEPEVALRGGARFVPRLVRIADVARTEPAMDGDGVIVVTGGTTGIGAALARHLVFARGARDLVLTSRRGSSVPGVEGLLGELTAVGARVRVVACDVSDSASVEALLDGLADGPPLKAIVHAAGVLDDALLAETSADRLTRIFRPKVDAAWLLHKRTQALLVLYSSISGVVGTAGQAGYAAANTWMDALAAVRRAEGLPALSIAWGAWGEAGMFAQLADAERARLQRSGLVPFSTLEGLAAYDQAERAGEAVVVACAFDADALRNRPEGPPALMRLLVPTAAVTGPVVREVAPDFLLVARREIALGIGLAGPSALPPDEPLVTFGLDSLLAVDIRGRLEQATGLNLPATLLFDFPTARTVAMALEERSRPAPQPEQTRPLPPVIVVRPAPAGATLEQPRPAEPDWVELDDFDNLGLDDTLDTLDSIDELDEEFDGLDDDLLQHALAVLGQTTE